MQGSTVRSGHPKTQRPIRSPENQPLTALRPFLFGGERVVQPTTKFKILQLNSPCSNFDLFFGLGEKQWSEDAFGWEEGSMSSPTSLWVFFGPKYLILDSWDAACNNQKFRIDMNWPPQSSKLRMGNSEDLITQHYCEDIVKMLRKEIRNL